VLASAVVYRMALRFADEAYDEWLLDSARSLSQLIQLKDQRVSVELPGTTLQAFVFDAHDRVLFRIDDEHDGLVSGQVALHAPSFNQPEVSYNDLWVDGQAMRSVQVIRHDLRAGSAVSIMVAESLNKRHRLASRVLGTVMALSAVLGLLTVLLARDAVTRGLRPLVKLSETIRLRAPGDLTRLPDTDVAQELRTFTDAINETLGQLAHASQLQRRFIADAAHQLRTPLAAARARSFSTCASAGRTQRGPQPAVTSGQSIVDPGSRRAWCLGQQRLQALGPACTCAPDGNALFTAVHARRSGAGL